MYMSEGVMTYPWSDCRRLLNRVTSIGPWICPNALRHIHGTTLFLKEKNVYFLFFLLSINAGPTLRPTLCQRCIVRSMSGRFNSRWRSTDSLERRAGVLRSYRTRKTSSTCHPHSVSATANLVVSQVVLSSVWRLWIAWWEGIPAALSSSNVICIAAIRANVCVPCLAQNDLILTSLLSHHITFSSASCGSIAACAVLERAERLLVRSQQFLCEFVFKRTTARKLTLRWLMSYIYIWSTHSWCF